jgi:putative ABC transport system permease protein
MRLDDVRLDPDRPSVAILARDIDPRHPENRLPMVAGGTLTDRLPPAWVSESAAAVYQIAIGDRIALPLAGRRTEVRVAGIFRDYGRQQGAIVIERSLYRGVTGDPAASAAALWLRPGAGAGDLRDDLAWLGPQAEVKDTSEIRGLSLSIFDRTFAITYALVAVAVVIGLAALGANLGALILARRHEFAVLRHLGMRRRDIAAMLLAQSALITATGLAVGCAVGQVVGAILIFVVNRQSFNWTMELHVPLAQIAILACCLMGLALLVTALSARGAVTGAVVRAVAEDW